MELGKTPLARLFQQVRLPLAVLWPPSSLVASKTSVNPVNYLFGCPVMNKKRRLVMRIDKGVMVALGYGKFFRSDCIVGLAPIEDGRGPGQRTTVYVDNLTEPVIASRSENAILRDLVGLPRQESQTHEQYELLSDVLDAVSEINPVLRSIIRDQGHWDLDRLEERAREVLGDEQEHEGRESRTTARA
jgi:hypothetical protein